MSAMHDYVAGLDMSRPMQIARHEAAHAVVAALVGFRIKEVSIVPILDTFTDVGSMGHCWLREEPDEERRSLWDFSREELEQRAMYTLAGPAVDGVRPPSYWMSGRSAPVHGKRMDEDLYKAYLFAERITHKTISPGEPRRPLIGAILRHLYERTKRTISQQPVQVAIDSVARVLIRKKTVGEATVVLAVKKAFKTLQEGM